MPEPDTTPAACGFRHDEWDGPYRMPRRCTAPAGHSDGQFAYYHGPWETLPLSWVDPPTDGTTPGTSGRTETGATTPNPQAASAEAGDTGADNGLRAGIAKVLGIGAPVSDHDLIEHVRAALIYRFRADQEVLLKDAALNVRDQEMQALRDELAENNGVIRALRRQRDTAEEALARVRKWIAGEPVTGRSEFGNGYREALRDITDLLTPHAPGDHGGEGS